MGAGVMLRMTELAYAITGALAMPPERMALLRFKYHVRTQP